MKQFYSCVDTLLSTPQPEQHDVSRRKAEKEGGQIVFYGAEEYRVVKHQPFILDKLRRTEGIDGVIFFSVEQFCYGDRFNARLLRDILKCGFSAHFAREDISLDSVADFARHFISLSAYFNAKRRQRSVTQEEILCLLG
jgi:hypothetical protein